MNDDLHRFARSFDTVADAYDRGRPSYPDEAVTWLVGSEQKSVLEVGAGTGKLTERLLALGHDVHATEPSRAMLDLLKERLPDVRSSYAAAESLPALEAFHWFDQETSLAEFARVLRPGGRVALLWNTRDVKIPWVRKLGTLIGDQDAAIEAPESLVRSQQFGFVEESSFRHWQTVNRDSLCDMALSRSTIATLESTVRERKLAEVRALYDDYGRGVDGMQFPWIARCFRASVIEHHWSVPPRAGAEAQADDEEGDLGPSPKDDREDTAPLLIDFR
jgi:SAM-dependent methyltransferase